MRLILGNNWFQLLICASWLLLIFSNICFAQAKKQNTQESETFFFSYALKSRLNPEFKLCVPITEEHPFQIEWLEQEIKSTLTVILKKTDNDKYPVQVTLTEGTKEKAIYSGMMESELLLEKPYRIMDIVSSLFNNTYEQNINLSKKAVISLKAQTFSKWKAAV